MKALRNLTVLALVALAAAACTTVPETSLITGSLSYRGQPRVPPGATADVTLFEQGREAPQPVITQQSIPAGDGRAPLRFDLRVGNEQINQPNRRYAVRGSVRDGAGTVLFVTESQVAVNPAGSQDIGTLVLIPVPPKPMPPVSGGPAAPRGTPNGAYVARGNEPGWMLSITGKTMTLESDYGASKLEGIVPAQQKIPGGYRYVTRAGNQLLRVDVLDRICRDDAGNSLPDTVTVQAGNKTLRGCGGDPAFLLQRGRWLVWSINGQDMATNARPTLVFEKLGRMSGRACNSYSGSYQVSGEGLRFGAIVSTKRACAPPLGEQENALFAVLRDAVRYELGADGSLTIQTSDGRRLVARKG